MKRQLLPILVIATALVAITAFKWVDPYHAFCMPCWQSLLKDVRRTQGTNVDCIPADHGMMVLCKREAAQ